MTKLGLDYETFSETNIKSGLDRYSNCESTEVLMLGWAFDDDEPSLWLPHTEPMPRDLRDALTLPGVEKRAWNATFEILITLNVLGMELDLNQWIDPMIMAHYCSLPGALDRAGKIIRLPEEMLKMTAEGKRLIKKFSIPQKPTKKQPLTRLGWWTDPQDFSLFGDYCRQDVVTERAIWKRLRKFGLPDHEWDNWRLDFKINQRGYPIEAQFARSASKAFAYIRREIVEELNEVTGLDNSKSTAQMSDWVRDRGYKRTNMQKDNVKKAVRDDDLDPLVIEVLENYQKARSTNPSKYDAILKILGSDSRARNSMQFMGAQRTHREAGRTVQFQNISRPSKPFEDFEYAAQARRDVMEYSPGVLKMLYDDPMDTIVSLIRSTIKAPPGRQLAVADLASIENVMLGFLARCEKTLGEFREGKDPYLAFAVYLFDTPYEELLEEVKNGDKSKRTLAKPGKLGAGYRLGGGDMKKNGDKTGLWGYAENLGVQMTQEEAKRSIDVFREQYPDIVQMWYELETACKRVISGAAKVVQVGYMTIDAKGPFMRICMPSGSNLHYLRPKIEEKMTPWGALRATITYEGIDQYTGKWTRLMTHGGKLTENCIAEGTEVLTDKGWVRIEEITQNHLVHDGKGLVEHEGLVNKSVQFCIKINGVDMTEDHEILCHKDFGKQHFMPARNAEFIYRPGHRAKQTAELPETDREDTITLTTVYDIKNAGPRQRFIVKGAEGVMIVHNCTQKAARDVLFHGLQNAEKAGLMTVGHVHDEIIAEVDHGDEEALQKLIEAMTEAPPWASDLPLNASGYLSDFYTKD